PRRGWRSWEAGSGPRPPPAWGPPSSSSCRRARRPPHANDMNTWVRPILLVEDNPMDVDLTLQAFREHSVANPVVTCRDGDEALRYMEEHHTPTDVHIPILVLLDLRLPKVDGIDVLREARQHPVWK